MQYDTRLCEICKDFYSPKRVDQRTCNKNCRLILHSREHRTNNLRSVNRRRKPRIRTSTAKTCLVCDELKLYSEFNKRAAMADGHNSECRACLCARNKNRYTQDRAQIRKNQRAYLLKTKYNLTEDELNELVVSQDNKCKICKKEFDEERRFVVDHDHVTHKVRGALCIGCNTSLGHFGDDEVGALSALNYVRVSLGKAPLCLV
jgi:hypothetical protein